jgi:hypothetical protein
VKPVGACENEKHLFSTTARRRLRTPRSRIRVNTIMKKGAQGARRASKGNGGTAMLDVEEDGEGKGNDGVDTQQPSFSPGVYFIFMLLGLALLTPWNVVLNACVASPTRKSPARARHFTSRVSPLPPPISPFLSHAQHPVPQVPLHLF